MDTLVLKGLKFRGLHGFYEQERIDGNDFEVDITFQLSLQDAAESDDLSKTIDYQEAYGIISEIMNGPSVKLIEHLAYKIGESLFRVFPAESVEVSVRKLSPPIDAEIEFSEVTLRWPR